MPEAELIFTEDEKAAKEFMMNILRKGPFIPCDIGNISDLDADLPQWFDEKQFKRGQKYFMDNRFGMLQSNMVGLLSLLADPKGLRILMATGKSSTPATAKKRYASTLVHMMSWYELDLSHGSKSWESLKRVRRLHLHASNSTKKMNIGHITQVELALTVFGFMGYALIRPHLLGIRYNNDDDREGFVHFWAVIGHMIGVREEFNMCLFPLKVVETICEFIRRYIFIPEVQLETQLFREMADAYFEGVSDFFPCPPYDVQMFLVKRIVGVPGYQYDIDISKEVLCRPLLTIDDMKEIQQIYLAIPGYEHLDITMTDGVPLLDIRRNNQNYPLDKRDITDTLDNTDNNQNIMGAYTNLSENNNKLSELHKLLGLTSDEQLKITFTDNSREWQEYLNDSRYQILTKKNQTLTRWFCRMFKLYEYSFGRYLLESGLNVVIFTMRRFNDKKQAKA